MRIVSAIRVLTLAIAVTVVPAVAGGQTAALSELGHNFASDFRDLANNSEADLEDIVTAPLHLDKAGELLRKPAFYYTLIGSAALVGGAFALDQTVRARIDHMSPGTANDLQDISNFSVGGYTALLYGYGLFADDERARECAITAGMGAGLASLFTLGLKAGFGRLRPESHKGHTAFFDGGESFVSGDVTPLFALAAGVSEYFDNRWYVAVPAYSLAMVDGFGRMGHDAHWLSDVVGAALVGAGTTELLFYLHKMHAEDPSRFRIFPVANPPANAHSQISMATGVGVEFNW